MAQKITIDPITRLEGHGKIEIFLDEQGEVERAFFQVPELRGFEQFCVGRPAEEMPRITPRICGVCPTAHHMASTKCLDDLWKVEPTSAAKKIRELAYSAFYVEDHFLHFFFLGGPDFVVGPDAPAAERNILGVIAKVGLELAGQVIRIRKELRQMMQAMMGKVIHPVFGLPGGVSKGLTTEDRDNYRKVADFAVEFAQGALGIFDAIVLKNDAYVDLILSEAYTSRTYSMGLVDEQNRPNFYDGKLRVVDPEGKEFARFPVRDYTEHIAEHVEPWSYITFPYLKKIGWKGFVDGAESGVYRVAPLSRLNVAERMATPLAQAAYEKMYEVLGGRPSHCTLAFHWARLVEALYAAERMQELLADEEIISPDIRNLPTEKPSEGIGVVEAPRGTLIHHYRTDEKGLITAVNLIVATNHNSAPIAMSVEKAARGMVHGPEVTEGMLNLVEMAFRPYDPCLACATHALGQTPLVARIYDKEKNLIKTVKR
ncbi:MAG: F420-nonreducing hydrogenase [Candidatus Glassbacteria bacterium RIFCSPLOWO2_12_FULL_58_11]|uniref:F420-nonreducing hydrogenase n=1 Tax=Candidatus Glassbacteria bacterium RIFCSPLOWO2_12_FULL_58_11 TaxID=1817867 RepID=A0A1F5YWP8_9BACT|nr:MAG: F420-nonreducing hydrogenase [Candidatus Glassbacteria bacterium RIFCSPLOWO2_12_FULL_58_11]